MIFGLPVQLGLGGGFGGGRGEGGSVLDMLVIVSARACAPADLQMSKEEKRRDGQRLAVHVSYTLPLGDTEQYLRQIQHRQDASSLPM